jgi:hypothetical protein
MIEVRSQPLAPRIAQSMERAADLRATRSAARVVVSSPERFGVTMTHWAAGVLKFGRGPYRLLPRVIKSGVEAL